ncbi:acyl-CoA dehydrogenase family protein [Lutimaribacter sp. EGI FJ00015]|uniref:Acyl-CoA dehydrogenase family protein n=1 Tax=Lutimaribacter degradans TaxID=2945989 RepID=A0ACC5ZTF2_9RHOB|nr:acyl-CoA dehydrogenase family protein [Lutimaribacter sp. EGI FJ00013]MCM2561051.1 acyl-CoA dehydrogenase family protein [Lutimaribacter sp. EGI FJ00013]MCO0612001.1 acyl-CoA dehydrogenase family protein [Lutimaribacter sp. EGI FJ00015]MCO0634879.1 acyl-CoA dehydrogenase family protein [Lutimaribacter sp. EGI FJ00014]
MTTAPHSQLATHDVTNQPEPRADRDLWSGDTALRAAARWAGADATALAEAGRLMGRDEMRQHAENARRDAPRLHVFDRSGRRRDEVEFHPGYHAIMDLGMTLGYAARPWEDAPGGHATHAGLVYYMAQLEPGISCPLTMTYAAVPALRDNPALAETWVPRLTARVYDPSIAPVGRKRAATMGMAMTEKQGGSDVRANATTAAPHGDHYTLRGHKWFCSAPMCDGFLTLAHAPGGLTCFLVPRWLEEGRNTMHLMRLKDKLGNRANASSEIEYHDAVAYRLGEEGQGVKTIIEMVHHTRLDTAMAPAGLMRAALDEAYWWVSGRAAFQRRLIDQPLMRAVMADLALEVEAATALAFGAARAFDGTSEADRAFARISVALAKFISNKRAPVMIVEAMECLGGMGYIEETPMPMLYREAPLNGIWEGSGNVICLDILRTLVKEPLATEGLMTRLQSVIGRDPRYDAALRAHQTRWPALPPEAEARWFAESAANLLAAAYLLELESVPVAEGFIATRLEGQRGHVPGAVSGIDIDGILARLG